jgi:hypothetical protein
MTELGGPIFAHFFKVKQDNIRKGPLRNGPFGIARLLH